MDKQAVSVNMRLLDVEICKLPFLTFQHFLWRSFLEGGGLILDYNASGKDRFIDLHGVH